MTRRKRQPYDLVANEDNDDDVENNTRNDEETQKKPKGRRRKRRMRRDDESFLITNLKVGSALAILCIVTYGVYYITSNAMSRLRGGGNGNGGNVWSKYVNDDAANGGYYGGDNQNAVDQKSKIFPNFDVDDEQIDAFTITEPDVKPNDDVEGEEQGGEEKKKEKKKINSESKAILQVLDSLRELRKQFAELYGGENAARAILHRGIISFPSIKSDNTPEGLRNTARRIFKAKKEKKPFQLSFAGSSAVAGIGNYLEQTFPSVLAHILTEPMQLLGVELEVRNAAIADISSFPYGWCLDNYMGDDVDVISWDVSLMNRADTTSAFEAYLRRAVSLDSSPMVIVREGTYDESRRELLQTYVDSNVMIDPIVINVEAAAEPFLDLHTEVMPAGFQDWLEFGAPDGAPGKTRTGRTTRLSVKQHQLTAWLISMHFITAIELGLSHIQGMEDDDTEENSTGGGDWLNESKQISINDNNQVVLPKPQSITDDIDPLMFGKPMDGKELEWRLNNIHCMTTFEPILSGNLQDMVVSGTATEDIDLSLPRGPMLYNKNWVMDLGFEAKKTLFSFQKYDFDYRYQKKAYFGVQPSGNMTMFVPIIQKQGDSLVDVKKSKPSDFFDYLIVCEVNDEYVGEKTCNMEQSLAFMIDESKVEAHYIESNGVSYQGKKICVKLNIPSSAKWTTRKKIEETLGVETSKKGLFDRFRKSRDDYGFSLQISVADKLLFWKDGPCSISHVLWE